MIPCVLAAGWTMRPCVGWDRNRAGTGEGTYKGGDHRRTASTFAATLEAEWRLREAGRARREVAARDHVPACPEGAAGDIPTTETIQSEALSPDDIPMTQHFTKAYAEAAFAPAAANPREQRGSGDWLSLVDECRGRRPAPS